MTTFVFHEWNSGESAVFDSKEKLNLFVNSYQHRMIDENGDPPQKGEDYSIIECKLNPDFNEWWNS